jgi:hypothetical protein
MNVNILQTEPDSGTVKIEISGEITEVTDFTKTMPRFLLKTLIINCKKIKKLNSTGVKKWIMYFESLERDGYTLIFEDLSPLVVEQRNQIKNFLGSNSLVTTMVVPFHCNKPLCKTKFDLVVDATSIINHIDFSNDSLDAHPDCPKCKENNTEFDDFVNEYFIFLKPLKVKKSA